MLLHFRSKRVHYHTLGTVIANWNLSQYFMMWAIIGADDAPHDAHTCYSLAWQIGDFMSPLWEVRLVTPCGPQPHIQLYEWFVF